jgi:NADH:ubiquinone oxidoreductase subunit D
MAGLRTAIINASQRVCGNRFGRGWIRPVRPNPSVMPCAQDLLTTLRAFLPRLSAGQRAGVRQPQRACTFSGRGLWSARRWRASLGLTGVVARASGLALDLRDAWPGAIFTPNTPRTETHTSGDCWARMVVRMREAEGQRSMADRPTVRWGAGPGQHARPACCTGSVRTIIATCGRCADDKINGRQLRPQLGLQPHALCVSLVEGVRGPVMLALETDTPAKLIHAKVQDPSLANWFGLAWALRNQANFRLSHLQQEF